MKFMLTLIAALAIAASAHAQGSTYPDGVVKVLVGYPAGQTTDMLARTVTERLAIKWKSPIIVENIPGAGSTLAASAATRAKKDGQTILFTANAAMTVGPHIYDKLSYQPLKDFEFVNLSVWVPYVCAVTPGLPVTDMKSLHDYIKKNPEKVAYGSPGVGSMSHLTMEMLKADHDFNVLHVPYKGSSAVLTDLVSGNIQFACEPPSVMAPLIKAGRIKPLAVTSEKRLPIFPDLPTIGETYPGFTSGAWVGVVAPKGVPVSIIQRLDSDISSVLMEPAVKEKFESMGLVIMSQGTEQFTKYVNADYERFGKLIKSLNLKQ